MSRTFSEAEKSSNDEELQLDPEQLEKMKKDELLRLAADMEVEVTEDMTKKEIAHLYYREYGKLPCAPKSKNTAIRLFVCRNMVSLFLRIFPLWDLKQRN